MEGRRRGWWWRVRVMYRMDSVGVRRRDDDLLTGRRGARLILTQSDPRMRARACCGKSLLRLGIRVFLQLTLREDFGIDAGSILAGGGHTAHGRPRRILVNARGIHAILRGAHLLTKNLTRTSAQCHVCQRRRRLSLPQATSARCGARMHLSRVRTLWARVRRSRRRRGRMLWLRARRSA